MKFPRWASKSRLSVVDGCANISRSIAGAMKTGAFIDRYVVISMLSAMPWASLPMVEADAGAISIASAQRPRSTWLFHVPSRPLKNSLMTGWELSAESVIGVINSFPAGVMTICTSAPARTNKRVSTAALYAAILPVIPRTICLPLSTPILATLRLIDTCKPSLRL